MAIEQVAYNYIEQGYLVNKEVQFGNYRADVVARKGTEQIVIEVKAGKTTPERIRQIAGLSAYVRNLGGYKFFVALANPPRDKKLEIVGIKQLVTNYFHSVSPDALGLSTIEKPVEVIDMDIYEMRVSGNSVFTKGKGVASVEFQIDFDITDPDYGKIETAVDNFPFVFEMERTMKKRAMK